MASRLVAAPKYLTRFYLMISLGGAGGAVLVGIVAPIVLPANFELIGGLTLCALLLLWQVRRLHPVFIVLASAAVIAAIGCGVWAVREFYDDVIVARRNFYGVLRVTEWGADDAVNHRRSLIHGSIMHGTQFQAPDLRTRPTSYYTQTSGIGRLLESLHPRKDPLKVGVIGLGTGTIATYGAKGDTYRFYDINPQVIATAQREFTYLADSAATIELPLGDARLSLEREPQQNFDVLAVDGSRARHPVHLITEPSHLQAAHEAGRVIAFHDEPLPRPVPCAGTRRCAGPCRDPDPRRHGGRMTSTSMGAVVDDPACSRGRSSPTMRRRSSRGRTGACGPMTSTTCGRC
jgi:hypothetical protein